MTGVWTPALAAPTTPTTPSAPSASSTKIKHVFVIVEENKDYDQILNPDTAPNIAGLAAFVAAVSAPSS